MKNAGKTKIFVQAEPTFRMEIEHSMNCYPSIILVGADGIVGYAGYEYIDENNLVVTTDELFKGEIALNKN